MVIFWSTSRTATLVHDAVTELAAFIVSLAATTDVLIYISVIPIGFEIIDRSADGPSRN